jgi:hypothetical protein
MEPIATKEAAVPLAAELRARLLAGGLTGENWTAHEILRMPKVAGQPMAIPPREAWPSIIPALRVFEKIRPFCGSAELRGFRSTDYNEAVGGTKPDAAKGKRGSAHLFFEALDIIPRSSNAQAWGEALADWYVGTRGRIGFGAYGAPGNARKFHIDIGNARRAAWRDAPAWCRDAIRKAGQ